MGKRVVLRTWQVYWPRSMPPMRKKRKDAWRTDEYIKHREDSHQITRIFCL